MFAGRDGELSEIAQNYLRHNDPYGRQDAAPEPASAAA
jgi:hypothetical protein